MRFGKATSILLFTLLILTFNGNALSFDVGKLAPDFSLKAVDGTEHKLSDYKGQVVLLEFWASWCKPCMMSIPYLNSLQERYGSHNFVVIAVNVEKGKSVDFVQEVIEKKGMKYMVLHDKRGKAAKSYKVRALPTTVLVDAEGFVVMRMSGFSKVMEERLEKKLEKITKRPEAEKKPEEQPSQE